MISSEITVKLLRLGNSEKDAVTKFLFQNQEVIISASVPLLAVIPHEHCIGALRLVSQEIRI